MFIIQVYYNINIIYIVQYIHGLLPMNILYNIYYINVIINLNNKHMLLLYNKIHKY